MWRCNRAGRASCDATFAGAATISRRFIQWQFECRQNFREEKPRPQFFVDQHRALAMPANSSLRRMIALQNRAGVDVTFLLSAELAKEIVDLAELFFDHIVIVVAPSVARDTTC